MELGSVDLVVAVVDVDLSKEGIAAARDDDDASEILGFAWRALEGRR